MGMKRGQKGPELIVIISVLLIILSVMLIVNYGFERQVDLLKKKIDAGRVARNIASSANKVYQSGPGTSYEFYNFGNEEFNVSITGYEVHVEYEGGRSIAALVTDKTTYSQIEMNENVRVRNLGGTIYVEPA